MKARAIILVLAGLTVIGVAVRSRPVEVSLTQPLQAPSEKSEKLSKPQNTLELRLAEQGAQGNLGLDEWVKRFRDLSDSSLKEKQLELQTALEKGSWIARANQGVLKSEEQAVLRGYLRAEEAIHIVKAERTLESLND